MTVSDLEPIFENEFLSLYPQQKQAIFNSLTMKDYIINSEQGTGKSLMGIYLIKCWLQLGLVKKVLILTKAEVVSKFYKELITHIPELNESNVLFMKDNNDRELFDKDAKVYICDYNQLKLCYYYSSGVSMKEYTEKKRKVYKSALGITSDWGVILDEVQQLKNIKSDTHKIVKKNTKEAVSKIGLSGTIIEKIEELYAIIQVIAPKLLPMGYPFFILDVAVTDPRTNQILRYKEDGVRRVRQRIDPIIYILKKSDIVSCVPKITTDIEVEFTPEFRSIYDKAINDIQYYKDEWGFIKKHNIAEIIQAVYNTVKNPIPENPRFQKFDRWVRRITATEKLVVWERNPEIMDKLSECYTNRGIKCLKIHGGISKELRAGIIQEFDTNPEIKLLFVSYLTSSEGWDIPSRTDAKRMIYYSLPDSTIQYHQSSDRLHRINSKAGVSIYRMILKGSIDEWAVNLLEYKTKLRDGIIDKKEYAEIETLSYERLLGINKRSIL